MLVIVIEAEDNAKVHQPEPKTKVTRADIVVEGTPEKPYFCIYYDEVGSDETTIGFGSYCLDYVFAWRDQYLEIIDKGDIAPCGNDTQN